MAVAIEVLAKLDAENATAMLSAGGRGCGGTWTAIATSPYDLMPNAHWVVATSDRLRIPVSAGEAVCNLTTGGPDAVQCSTALQGRRWHGHTCGEGVARLRPHRALQSSLTRAMKTAGAETVEERYIP